MSNKGEHSISHWQITQTASHMFLWRFSECRKASTKQSNRLMRALNASCRARARRLNFRSSGGSCVFGVLSLASRLSLQPLSATTFFPRGTLRLSFLLQMPLSFAPAGKGPFIHTSLFVKRLSANSQARPGPLNLCEQHFLFFEKIGCLTSWNRKCTPSTLMMNVVSHSLGQTI